jgi:restriction system protein
MTDSRLIPASGGFRKLHSFQCAQAIYDGTVIFCERFVDKKSRTHDQMVQAARSGAQNIAEGSLASATSKKTELKLTGVARASLGELLLDYEDYLRQHKMLQWEKESVEGTAVRGLWKRVERGTRSDRSDNSDLSPRVNQVELYRFSSLTAEDLANTQICLINQTSYLLWQQMKTLEKDFLTQVGFTEKLYQVRKTMRDTR